MDNKDTFVLDSSPITEGITFDLSNYDAAQSAYTMSGLDTITITGFNWTSDWLMEQNIVEQHQEEQRIRDTHPAVQHAWEQYQIMLNLAREDEKSTEDTQ